MSSRPRINKIHHNVGSASYCFVWDTAVRRRSTWYNYDISVIQICQSNISFFMPLIRRSLLRDIYQRHLQLQKKQEVWPPGSADTVCPRRPLMTHVQHWTKTAQTDHVTLRSWPLTLEVMRLWLMRVVVLYPCTKFEVRWPWHSEDMAHDVCQH